jgi:hypothetical protein
MLQQIAIYWGCLEDLMLRAGEGNIAGWLTKRPVT